MQPKSFTYTGPLTTYGPGATITVGSGNILSVNVTCDSIRPGNRVDPNPWWYNAKVVREFKGTHRQQWPIGYEWDRRVGALGSGSNSPESPVWDRDLLYAAALEKFNTKVRGSLDLGVTLAEAHTTSRMFRTTAAVLNHARQFRRGAFSFSGVGTTKDVADGWLQWQYGWKPLMNDVFRVADESIRIVINRIKKVEARVTWPIQVDDTPSRTIYNVPGVVKRSGSGRQSCTIACHLTVPDFDLARWSSLNPVSLGWELIPYSFVVDWFVDVGSYLRNLETALLYSQRFRSGYISELFAYTGTEVSSRREYTTGQVRFIIDDGASAKIKETRFQRTKLTSYPVPHKPTMKVDLNSYRMFSAAALLRQLLK